jgi:hypothetical protein
MPVGRLLSVFIAACLGELIDAPPSTGGGLPTTCYEPARFELVQCWIDGAFGEIQLAVAAFSDDPHEFVSMCRLRGKDGEQQEVEVSLDPIMRHT